MRAALTYYGGKQRLARRIVGLLPPHHTYCEPFAGGAAVLFHKEPSRLEVLNDTNERLMTFYRVAQTDPVELTRRIQATLHSRKAHERAGVVYSVPEYFSDLDVAWAVWVTANQSVDGVLATGFSVSRSGVKSRTLARKRDMLREQAKRLELVLLECRPAIDTIVAYDSESTAFYVDPPYVGFDQGHYAGYTQEHFDRLLKTLATISGRFILSSYRNKALNEVAKRHGWYQFEIRQRSSMGTGSAVKTRIEVLTANYPIALEGATTTLSADR